jgi:hypothetical protein
MTQQSGAGLTRRNDRQEPGQLAADARPVSEEDSSGS